MSDLLEDLRRLFQDEDARYAYVESALNTFVAAQIKTLREDRGLSQHELADMIGTKQSGVSRLENVNYSAWKVETLSKLARAFGLWLHIEFKEFGGLPHQIENFRRESLRRRSFESDPVFKELAQDRAFNGTVRNLLSEGLNSMTSREMGVVQKPQQMAQSLNPVLDPSAQGIRA